MKKVLLVFLCTLCIVDTFAQTFENKVPANGTTFSAPSVTLDLPNARTSAVAFADTTFPYADPTQFNGDSLINLITYYGSSGGTVHDSGYFFGTNILENATTAIGAAQAYSFPGHDTTTQIIGIVSEWFGFVKPGSANTIKLKVWKVDSSTIEKTPIAGAHDLCNLPGMAVDSVIENFIKLGVNSKSLHYSFFTTPLPASAFSTKGAFYVGYELTTPWSSLGGDTIRVGSTKQIYVPNVAIIKGGDTVILVSYAYKIGTAWYDFHYEFSADVFISIAPLVNLYKGALSVSGIKSNNLTFYGNYPNPATVNTNIKFALANTADITINITDLSGRSVKMITQHNMSQGEHIIPVNTTGLATGDYIYLIRTSEGGSVACKMAVAR